MILKILIIILCVFQFISLVLQPEFVFFPLMCGWMMPALIALFACLSFWAVGGWILRRIFPQLEIPLYNSCALLAGSTFYGYVFYVLSAVHFLNVSLLIILLFLPGPVWIIRGYRVIREKLLNRLNVKIELNLFESLLLTALMLMSIFLFAACHHPVTWYDALIYHLSIPQKMLQAGELINIPGNVYSHLTLIPQFIYGYLLASGSESSIHYLILYVYLLLGLEVGMLLKRSTRSRLGSVLFVFLFITHPEIYMQIMRTGVDVWGVVTVSILFIFILKQGNFGARQILFISFMLALLTGIKVNLLMYFFPPVLCYVLFNTDRRFRFVALSFMLGMISLTYMFFGIKNYLFSGNPLFPYIEIPLFRSIWNHDQYEFFRAYHLSRASIIDGIQSWLLYPGHIIFLLVLFYPHYKFIGLLFLSICIWCFFSPGALRFIWGLDPVLLYLCIDYLTREKFRPYYRNVIFLVLFLYGVGVASLSFLKNYDFLTMNLGLKSFETYKNQMPDPYFRMVKFINQSLPETSHILLIGEARTYGIYRKHHFATVFDKNVLEDVLSYSDSLQAVINELSKLGFSHVVYSENEWNRLNSAYHRFFKYGRAGYFITSEDKMELLDSVLLWIRENAMDKDLSREGVFVVSLR